LKTSKAPTNAVMARITIKKFDTILS